MSDPEIEETLIYVDDESSEDVEICAPETPVILALAKEPETKKAEPEPPPVERRKMRKAPAPPDTIMTLDEIKSKYSKKCPKCSKFTKLVTVAEEDFGLGVYCTDECGYAEALKGKPARGSSVDWYIPNPIMRMLSTAPKNHQLRALVLSHLGTPIPRTCETWLEISDWISGWHDAKNPNLSPKTPTLKPSDRLAVRIEVGYSVTEQGTASYTARRNGYAHVELTDEELMEIVSVCVEQGLSLRTLGDSIKSRVRDKVSNNPPNTEVDRYHYSEHEGEDAEDAECEITTNTNSITEMMFRWMEEKHPQGFEHFSRE